MSKKYAIAAVTLLVYVIASTLVAQSHSPVQRANPPSNGRYMLVSVQLTTEMFSATSASTEDTHTVFKIDTITGETWKWTSMSNSQKHESIEGWEPATELKRYKGTESESRQQ